jgi:hypothetical protein
MQPFQVIEALRILLIAGFGLTALLAYVLMRADADTTWHRRYLDEHPGLRHDFEVWRRGRRRELLLAAGRCPDHDAMLDVSGRCAVCQRRPGG